MTTAEGVVGDSSYRSLKRRGLLWREFIYEKGMMASALVSILTTLAIIWVLTRESLLFFEQVSPWEFLTGTKWTPLFKPQHFGVLPLVCGTALITVGAALVSIPLGVGCGMYLSEYATPRVRATVKPILEILAGIPTVVYGYFAVTTVTPVLRAFLPSTEVFNAASASLVVGIMILPMVASLSDDAFRAVPNALRHAGFAVGATRGEVAMRIVFPAALSGVLASFVLAVSRAIGETMAVTLAAGASPKLTLNPLESVQTMTAYIVQVSLGDTPQGTIEYQTLFAVGMLLFAITLGLNILSIRILRRYREVYE